MGKKLLSFVGATFAILSILSLTSCTSVDLNKAPENDGADVVIPLNDPVNQHTTDTNIKQPSESTAETAPPTIDLESDILKDINPSEFDSIDFTGAKIEYLSGGLILETDGQMPESNVVKLFETLSAAEISSTPELIEEPWRFIPVGEDIRRFRITLNTNEKIHIGLDLGKFSDTLLLINNNFYKCDTKSLIELEKLRKEGSVLSFDPDNDPIMNVTPTELQSVDFSDAGIFVLWSAYDLTEYADTIFSNDVDTFAQCLKNASISSEVDSSYVWREEDNYNDFRISLSTGDVIYIGFDTSYSDDIFINGVPYKCDKETLEKLEKYS